MNTTEQTSDPTLWRYPSLWSANRTVHLRNLESEVAKLSSSLIAIRQVLEECKTGRINGAVEAIGIIDQLI